MKKLLNKIFSLLLVLAMLFSFAACGGDDPGHNDPVIDDPSDPGNKQDERIEKRDENGDVCEDGWYYCAEDVTEYIIEFEKVPSNFYTKAAAKEAGWKDGNLEKIIPGGALGGIEYSNNEKLLPVKSGRRYYYCDLNTHGKPDRGTERLVYSNDGLFYYSPDSFKSFTLFYGEPEEPKDPGHNDPGHNDPGNEDEPGKDISVEKDRKYYDKNHVALYIHTYGELPPNYVTKSEAKKAGWRGGSVEKYIEGAAIGGSQFSNNEGLLPSKKGRQYFECDIDTLGEKTRGAKRIIFSNDGLVYYTSDHYESFTLLYGEE